MAGRKDELEALHDAYDRGGRGGRGGRGRGGGGGGPPKGHLAGSHVENDAYMRDFERALEDMGMGGAGEGGVGVGGGRGRGCRVGFGGLLDVSGAEGAARVEYPLGSWRRGPRDPRGALVDLSERPLLCSAMSLDGSEMVVGGSDHGVYVLDLDRRCLRRTLYSRRYGHTEWVTCVSYLEDGSGRVVSGAMDAKLCLWSSSGVSCVDLVGHSGSVSDVCCLGGTVFSGGYDKTVRIWNAASGAEVGCLEGHDGPVLKLAVGGSGHLVSGGRDGVAIAWDVRVGKRVGRMAGHKGHVTAVTALGTPLPSTLAAAASADPASPAGAMRLREDAVLFATGGQDGHVRVWDVRNKRAVANVAAHVGLEGAGAVGDLVFSPQSNVLLSAGADAAVCVMDPRRGFQVRHRFEEHKDFIYSLQVAGAVVLSGAGDGTLFAHDLNLGTPLWALGANEAAVRCIAMNQQRLAVAGDDGNAIIYDIEA